jgi:branched-chain amino acid transport system permease protein
VARYMDFIQHLINGLLQGTMLTLMALGFSLVWGILHIVNLAHAATIMLSAYLTYFLWSGFGIDPLLSLPITMLALFIFGYLLQKYVINFVMRAPPLTTFLLTYGFEALLINLALRFWTADLRQTKPVYANVSLAVGQLRLPYTQLAGIVVTLGLTLLVYFYLDHTKAGRAIRAVAMDRIAARLMGVNISHIYALTFGIGAALSAAYGTLLSTTNAFGPSGFGIYNVLAFSIVVLGGLGSIPGVFIGGITFGLVYEFAGTYMLSQRDVIIFAILILVLVVKPTGLLGKEGYGGGS